MSNSDDKGIVPATNLPSTDVLDRIDRIAKIAAASGLTTYRRAESASMVLLTGRELGLGPMASLRGIHDVNGKPVLAADLMVAVVRRSGLCRMWRVVESTPTRCEIATRRVGEEHDESCVWTAEDARRAGCGGATWQKFPRQMLSHRCAAELARRVYSDVLLGLYSPDELGGEDAVDAPEERAPITVDVVSTQPAAFTLPRDNGPSPSGAPLPEAAPVDHYDVASKLLDGAATLPELGAAWRTINREHLGHLGPGEVTALTQAKDARKVALATQPPAPPPEDEPPPDAPKPRGRRSAKPADATGDAASAANDGAVDAPGARSTSGHPMATRAERRAHLATLRRPEDVRTSWRHRAAMPPAGYMEDCADRVCALTPGFGVEDALAYLSTPVAAKASHEPKTRAA